MKTQTAVRTITYVATMQGGPFSASTVFVPKTEEDRQAMIGLANEDGAGVGPEQACKLSPLFFHLVKAMLKTRHGVTLKLEEN